MKKLKTSTPTLFVGFMRTLICYSQNLYKNTLVTKLLEICNYWLQNY